jgi:RNA polymerase sigma-70 factor (ECF subfamily)
MNATSDPDFATWYRATHPGLAEAVLRTVRPPTLAADALDEAFARAFASWERVHAMRSPAGWVYRVAVNEARRQLRRATREDAVLALAPPPAPAPPASDEAWLLVETLPVRQRAAVVLRHVAGLTETEIGAALGVTRSTISSSLAAAYRSLAAKLADDEPRNPMPERERPLTLAVATACGPEGCEVERLDADGASIVAGYSDAVRDTIKVRPGDLVALDGTTIVWRWWSGQVESVAADGTRLQVSRNVTRSTPDGPRRATIEVAVPDDLHDGIEAGETVWFGSDVSDGPGPSSKVVVAVAGRESVARVAARFPAIRQALR